jgi:cell wall-associated NlpC family hydrolase
MRRLGLVLLCTFGLATLVAATARAHSTPQIRQAQSRERTVLAEVNRIGNNLQQVEDRAWNAQQQLAQVKQSLKRNEYRLHVAKGNLLAAQKRLMDRLYSLYVNGAPSTVDVIAGAHSISQLIDRAESAQVLTNQDAELGKQAVSFERTVQRRERQLKTLEQKRERTYAALKQEQRQKTAELAQEKRLLASIHTSIANLQAQEAARERRQRQLEEQRLRQQLAKQRAEQRQAAQQAQQAPPSTPVVAPPPPPPPNTPGGSSGAGHPQAAQIALHYLGVKYTYGGASPSTGFDCSGLVMYVYAQLGISLPHYTVAQWNATEPIASPAPGDLVFFNGLGHVGIYIGGGRFVDAPHTGSVVRIDSIAGFGSYDGARRVP